MMIGFGIALVTLSIALIRLAKRYELTGNAFWTMAAQSTWLPLVFTAMFGFGVVAVFGGAVQLIN